MQELVDFLHAQLDEDERLARAAVDFDYGVKNWADDGDPVNIHIARHDPARVLAEVEAKRAILERVTTVLSQDRDGWKFNDAPELADFILGDLALPYRDRPGWRPEWAPEQ